MSEFFKYFYIPKIKKAYSKKFSSTLIPQSFSLPKPIINYVLKNSTFSPNVYQKLLECCKYFYSKKLYLLLKSVKITNYSGEEWHLKPLKKATIPSDYCFRCKNVDPFDGFDIRYYDQEKIWITKSCSIDSENPNMAAEIMPKIYRSDIKKIQMNEQNLFFNDFCRLTPKVEESYLDECSICYDDKREVPFEIIFGSLHDIAVFDYKFPENATNFTTETMAKINKLPNFQKIEVFELSEIPATFDIIYFYEKQKTSKSYTKFMFEFREGTPEDFQDQIIAIIKELQKNNNYDYVFPYFDFEELHDPSLRNLLNLQYEIFKKYNSRKIQRKYRWGNDVIGTTSEIFGIVFMCFGLMVMTAMFILHFQFFLRKQL